jgi:pimeloyl-ACP methyl ester carboxylesterase
MRAEFLDSFIRIPGGKVFVRRWNSGQGDRSPIVLLHDSLGCVELWRDFPEALAKSTGREIIGYDRLGFGKSSHRAERPSVNFIDEEANTYFPIIQRELGFDRFVLFGHSVGGAMALAIAASQIEKCEAIITESAQAFVEQRTLSGIQAAKMQYCDPRQFDKLVRWHGDNTRWVLEAWVDVWLSPEFLSWNLDSYLDKIKYPVLAIHGDQDEFGSVEFPNRITSKVNGPAEMAILNQCGHVPHYEKREEVLRLVVSFLDRRLRCSSSHH